MPQVEFPAPWTATRTRCSRLIRSDRRGGSDELSPLLLAWLRPAEIQKMSNRKRKSDRGHAAEGVQGFSLIELLIVVAIILIIASIAIPSYLRSRMAASEASAVENLRSMTTASTIYNSQWTNGYPPSLGALGGTAVAATCDQAELLDPLMTTAPFQKSGYTFGYTGVGPTVPAVAGCSAPGYNAYLATATPIIAGSTGQRSFCSTVPGVIHFDPTGVTAGSSGACDALPTL